MAAGNTLVVFTAQHNMPPASNPATPDVRNALLVLDFDPTTDEFAIFAGVLPRHYAGGGLTIHLHVMASSATSGASRWEVGIERHQAGTDDSDSDSFATAQSVGITAVSPSGTEVVGSVAFTSGAQMDSLAAGERFRIQVRRDANGTTGTDDMAGDAELVAIEIRETP